MITGCTTVDTHLQISCNIDGRISVCSKYNIQVFKTWCFMFMSELLCSLFSVSDVFDEIKANIVFFRKQFWLPYSEILEKEDGLGKCPIVHKLFATELQNNKIWLSELTKEGIMSCEDECSAANLISLFAKLQSHSAKLDLHPVMNLTSLGFLVSGDKYPERFLSFSAKFSELRYYLHNQLSHIKKQSSQSFFPCLEFVN